MNMTLEQIARLLEEEGLLAQDAPSLAAAGTTAITGVDCDSRFAAPNHLFVCKGAAFKPAYLTGALAAGCVAYLCDESHGAELAATAPGAPALVVRDDGLRRAMAVTSAEAWGHPDRQLDVIGITGTKGKSTVAYMMRAILDAGEPKSHCAIMGSIDTFDGVEDAESVNTTPEPPDLWRHIDNAARSGLGHMVMEVSSQALKYDRVVGLTLDVSCFLNIGRDHISPREHPSFEDYFESKLRIFDQASSAVVNLESEQAGVVLEHARRTGRVMTFSSASDAAEKGADVWCEEVTSHGGIQAFTAHTPSWEGEVTLSMAGLFNVDNALAAIAMCELLDVPQLQVRQGLAHVRVPGRMELLPTADPKVTGIVDYAHNKLSYQKFFHSVAHEFADRKIIAVLGAPGGKAYERRQELPQEAAKWADHLIFTEEDPAHDSVAEICRQMAEATPAGCAHESIVERPLAIRRAVQLGFAAPNGAVICLLAKGDETVQHVGDRFVPMETDGSVFEREVAAALLAGADGNAPDDARSSR